MGAAQQQPKDSTTEAKGDITKQQAVQLVRASSLHTEIKNEILYYIVTSEDDIWALESAPITTDWQADVVADYLESCMQRAAVRKQLDELGQEADELEDELRKAEAKWLKDASNVVLEESYMAALRRYELRKPQLDRMREELKALPTGPGELQAAKCKLEELEALLKPTAYQQLFTRPSGAPSMVLSTQEDVESSFAELKEVSNGGVLPCGIGDGPRHVAGVDPAEVDPSLSHVRTALRNFAIPPISPSRLLAAYWCSLRP